MMAPFHSMRTEEPRGWMNVLVSCGDALEQNNRLNRPLPDKNRHDKGRSGQNSSGQNSSGQNSSNRDNKKDSRDHKGKPGQQKKGFVSQEKQKKRKLEGRCERCGKEGHAADDCWTGWREKSPQPKSVNAMTQNKKQRKKEDAQPDVRITELGSEAGKD